MKANSTKRIINPILSTPAGEVPKAPTNMKALLLRHLLTEALHARNWELDKLHRTQDLMLSPFPLQSSEIPALENHNNGTDDGVSGTQPHRRQHLRAMNFRYLPSVEPNSLAFLELKTILDVLLERIHFFVPYRAALIRLGDGTEKRPIETVARRVGDLGTRDGHIAQSYELLADAALKSRSDFPKGNGRQNGQLSGFTFPMNDALHWHLGIPPLADGRMLGVLSIFLQPDTSLGSRKIKLLSALAAQTARVILKSLTYEEIKHHIMARDQGSYNLVLRNLTSYSRKIHSRVESKQIRKYRNT